MLRACSLLLFAGCHLVYGLERPGHDEDGDGSPDDFDNCPHIASENGADTDGDGIGDVCDPNGEPQVARFFSFHENYDGLEINGSIALVGDDVVFGAPTEEPDTMFLVEVNGTPVVTDAGWINVGFTMLDPAPDNSYHEMGIVFGHTDGMQRGNVCFAGYDDDDTSGDPISYLQMDEHYRRASFKTATPTLHGNRATLAGSWTSADTACNVTATGIALSDHYDPIVPSGRLGVYQQHARSQIHYLWIATRP